MNNRFLHLTLLVVLCLSLAGKSFAEGFIFDSCQDSEAKVVAAADFSDSSSNCADSCNCHCHHHHFDFAALSESFVPSQVESENFDSDSAFLSPSLNSSQKRPPKLVA